MNCREVYEQLKMIDRTVAEEYLSAILRSRALDGILKDIRLILQVEEGDSVITAVRRLIGSFEATKKESRTGYLSSEKSSKKVSKAVSREEREALIERMAALGLEYSPKDSYKRMLRLVSRAENRFATDKAVTSDKEIMPEVTKGSGNAEKEKPVVSGW